MGGQVHAAGAEASALCTQALGALEKTLPVGPSTCNPHPPPRSASPPPPPLALASQDSPSAMISHVRSRLCPPCSHSAAGGFAEQAGRSLLRGNSFSFGAMISEQGLHSRGRGPGRPLGRQNSSSPTQQQSTSARICISGGVLGTAHCPHHHLVSLATAPIASFGHTVPNPSAHSCTSPATRPVLTSNEASLDLCR